MGSYYGDKADVWSVGCILLELLLGHEKFCDAWMTSFDYEILQNKAKFTQSITQTLDELPSHLNFSTELNSFVMQFLQLKTSLRPTLYGASKHPWLGHELDDTLEKLRVSRLRLEVGDGGRGMMGSASLQNLQDFGSGGGGGTMSSSPSVSNLSLMAGQGQGQVDIELVKAAFNNMSEKERHHIEEYILSKNAGGDSESGKRQQHQLVLPPIEPATPNIGNARKILKKGSLIAGEQITSGAFFGSPSMSVASFSPLSSPVPMNSRAPKSPRNGALPGLAEDKSISFSQYQPQHQKALTTDADSEDDWDHREDSRRLTSYSLTSECDSEAPQVPHPPLLKSNTEGALRGDS